MIYEFENGCVYRDFDKEHYSKDKNGDEWNIVKVKNNFFGLRGYGMGTEQIKLKLKEINYD